MSTMIERVAEAIKKSHGTTGSTFLDDARAAIEAMREPTVDMVAAFWRQKNCGAQQVGESGDDRSDYAAWRAAIDAALKEAA